MKTHNLSFLGALAFLNIIFNTAFAEIKNEKLSTNLSSNSAVCRRQDDDNICTYIGHAKLTQGITTLQAQQITIYKAASSKINKIVALGEHSHYSTMIENNTKPVNADADLITIYPDKHLLILEGHGQIVAGKDSYSGPHIEYKWD